MRPTPRKRVHPFPSNGATPHPWCGCRDPPHPQPQERTPPGEDERVRPRCGHASVCMRRSRAHAAVPLLALLALVLVLGTLGKKTVAWLAREGNELPLADLHLSGLAGVLLSSRLPLSNGSAAGLRRRPPASRAPTPATLSRSLVSLPIYPKRASQ